MSVYVDDMQRPARVGRLQARWSHLTSEIKDWINSDQQPYRS